MNKYICKHCKKIVERDSTKKWIKSYCYETGKNTRLILQNNNYEKNQKPK